MPKQQGEAHIPAWCVNWDHSTTAAMKSLERCNTAADNAYGGSLQLLLFLLFLPPLQRGHGKVYCATEGPQT